MLLTIPNEKITSFGVAERFNNAYIRVATLEKAVKSFQATDINQINQDGQLRIRLRYLIASTPNNRYFNRKI